MKNEKQMIYEEDIDSDSNSEEDEENEEEDDIIDLNDEIEIPIEEEEKIKIKILNDPESNTQPFVTENTKEKIQDTKKEESNEVKTTSEDLMDSARRTDKFMFEDHSDLVKKELLNLDLNDQKNKEEAIYMLMNSDNQQTPLKMKTQRSTLNKSTQSRKHTSASKINVSQMTKENPELNLNYDFNSAINKVMKKMIQTEDQDENSDLIKQLLLGDQYFNEDLKKKSNVNREEISEKVEKALEKKNQKIESIKERIHDEFSKNHTFVPNSGKTTNQPKRNLEDFIADQINFTKKKNEKINQIITEKEKSRLGEPTVPKINDYSKKIVEEKLRDNYQQPSFMRLYQHKPKAPVTVTPTKTGLNRSYNPDRINDLYKDVFKKKEKIEEMKRKVNVPEGEMPIKKNNSKVVLLNKFIKQYREAIDQLESSKFNSLISEEQTHEIHNSKENKSNLTSSDKINFEDLCFILTYLKMTIQMNLSIDNSVKSENKLVLEMFSELKNSDSSINKEDLFNFLLACLNFYELFLIKKNKKKSLESNHEELTESSKLPTEEKEKILKETINKDLEDRIVTVKKYGGLDKHDRYIITLDKWKEIFKEYNILSFNWSSQNIGSKKKEQIQNNVESFKPKIDKKSEQLSQQYRKKMELITTLESDQIVRGVGNSSSLKPLGHKQTSHKFLETQKMHRIKIEKEIALKREEKERNEKINCTFKPKINNPTKDGLIKVNRYEKLYQEGKIKRSILKNRNNEEIEIEKNIVECTFKPNINKKPFIPSPNVMTSNDKNLEKFNERMKVGRYEREVKQSLNERGKAILKQLPLDKKNNENSIQNQITNEENIEYENEMAIEFDGKQIKFIVNEEESLESLVERVCEENGLNEESKENVKALIENELSK